MAYDELSNSEIAVDDPIDTQDFAKFVNRDAANSDITKGASATKIPGQAFADGSPSLGFTLAHFDHVETTGSYSYSGVGLTFNIPTGVTPVMTRMPLFAIDVSDCDINGTTDFYPRLGIDTSTNEYIIHVTRSTGGSGGFFIPWRLGELTVGTLAGSAGVDHSTEPIISLFPPISNVEIEVDADADSLVFVSLKRRDAYLNQTLTAQVANRIPALALGTHTSGAGTGLRLVNFNRIDSGIKSGTFPASGLSGSISTTHPTAYSRLILMAFRFTGSPAAAVYHFQFGLSGSNDVIIKWVRTVAAAEPFEYRLISVAL